MPPPVDLALERVIRRNTVILGSIYAIGWAVIQLQSALTAITTEVLTGETAVAGVGSALFLVALGLGLGTVNLARVGAADMAPPDKRASRVGRVLLGAAVGAILGPIVFSPLLSNRTGA